MIVSLLGLVISLFAYLLAFPNEQTRRFDIYGALLALHILGCIAYWLLSFEDAMDAFLYYLDPYRYINEDPLAEGTYFIVHFVHAIRTWLGGTFLDHFLFFQCFGMIGLALIIRSLNEVALSLKTTVPLHVYLTLFLPGMHFWTAGIGKDGPMFAAISLAIWAAFRLQKRLVWMGLSLIVMILIRPHITPFVASGVFAALLMNKRISPRIRMFLAPIAAAGLLLLIGRAAESLNLSLSAHAVSDFVQGQQDLGADYGSGAHLGELPLPLKIFTLMFRPFWYDAAGVMGYAASLENTALMYFCLYILYNWKVVLSVSRNVFFVTYCIVFDALLILSLSLVSYNIGMGQRMKMMAVPAILILYGTFYMYNRVIGRQARALSQHSGGSDTQDMPAQAGAA